MCTEFGSQDSGSQAFAWGPGWPRHLFLTGSGTYPRKVFQKFRAEKFHWKPCVGRGATRREVRGLAPSLEGRQEGVAPPFGAHPTFWRGLCQSCKTVRVTVRERLLIDKWKYMWVPSTTKRSDSVFKLSFSVRARRRFELPCVAERGRAPDARVAEDVVFFVRAARAAGRRPASASRSVSFWREWASPAPTPN